MQFAFRWMNCLLMREISVKNTVRMWDTYLVCPCSTLDKSNDVDLSLNDRRKVRMPFLNFTCTFVRHFSLGGAKGSARWTFRYVGVCCPVVSFLTFASSETIGHHYVPTVIANTRLDGPRNRDAPQPSVRTKLDLAQRTEPLHGKVKIQSVSLHFTVKVPLSTSAHSFIQGAPTHNTNQPRRQSAVI